MIKMERIYENFIFQLFDGIKKYSALNLLDLEKNRFNVSNGRNGIYIEISGAYKLISKPELVTIKESVKLENLVLVAEIKFPDFSFCEIREYPYKTEGIETKINDNLLEENENELINNGNFYIRNPTFYSNLNEKLLYLYDYDEVGKSGKKIKLKKLEDFSFRNLVSLTINN